MNAYDNRMSLWENWRYGVWRPLICKIRGCKITCYKIVITDPQEWVWICHRCVKMTDSFVECGTCTNGCENEPSV